MTTQTTPFPHNLEELLLIEGLMHQCVEDGLLQVEGTNDRGEALYRLTDRGRAAVAADPSEVDPLDAIDQAVREEGGLNSNQRKALRQIRGLLADLPDVETRRVVLRSVLASQGEGKD